MKSITFKISKNSKWTKLFKRDTFENSLKSEYRIAFESDDRELSAGSDDTRADEFKTTWGNGKNQDMIFKYIERYRTAPGKTKFDQRISNAFHNFIFANTRLVSYFGEASVKRPEIFLKTGKDCDHLLLDIPWELTAKLPIDGTVTDPFIKTFASLPLARVVENTRSKLSLREKERLHVVYCISEPGDVTPIEAEKFDTKIEKILKDMSGFLTYAKIVGNQYAPEFNDLLDEIDRKAPHLLMVIGHCQTENGIPELRFEDWKPVNLLAECLARNGKTISLLLIACDLVFLDKSPSAISGVLTMLKHGIPCAIAMQSYVSVELAVEFIKRMVECFFKNTSISKAAVEGRKQMSEKSSAHELLDWTFPALFLTEDAPEQLANLSNYIENHTPLLEEMSRSFNLDPDKYYFSRKHSEDKIEVFFKENQRGVIWITGRLGSGKTTLVKYACRKAVEEAIRERSTSFRPILYVDFERYSNLSDNIRELADILKKRTEEIQRADVDTSLLYWPPKINCGSDCNTDDIIRSMIEIIDDNSMILVFDNVSSNQLNFFIAFIEKAQILLRKSLLIIVSEIVQGIEIDNAPNLVVDNLDETETRYYAEQNFPNLNVDGIELYEATGGILLLLNGFRQTHTPGSLIPIPQEPIKFTSKDIRKRYEEILIDNIETSGNGELLVLLYLALLPNGVNEELAKEYIADWNEFPGSVLLKDFLVVEYRYNKYDPWLRLPRILAQWLCEYYDVEIEAAANNLALDFIDRVAPDDQSIVKHNLERLANKDGGVDFLHDIHDIFLRLLYWEKAYALPLLMHEWFFERGQWYDSYKFWQRCIDKSPMERRPNACEWLKFGETARILGMVKRAYDCLEKARSSDPGKTDQIDILILEASLIKDSGQVEKAGTIRSDYEKATRMIVAVEGDNETPEVLEYTKRKALIFYNQAIFRRWRENNLDGALSDLNESVKIYNSLHMAHMEMVAKSEWVDMKIEVTKDRKEWEVMIRTLFEADEFFDSKNSSSDRALCNYRLARCYRRMPYRNENEQREYMQCTRDFYGTAYKQAKIAHDVRLQSIAQLHFFEVKLRDLREINESEALEQMNYPLGCLEELNGDAWSTRVLRDMLSLKAEIEKSLSRSTVAHTLENAWNIAVQRPLHPHKGMDALRAAEILSKYLIELERLEEIAEFVRFCAQNHHIIDKWVKSSNYLTDRKTFLKEIERFIKKKGGE